jgi:enoyl-CoA hydratase/carnithine racemase
MMTGGGFCTATFGADGAVRLTINNARKANILSAPVMRGLRETLKALAEDDSIRALVLASAGERSFIGGADVREMLALDESTAVAFIQRLRDLCEAVRQFPAPVVARIQGACLGGGLELAVACDLRVASTAATFAMPEVRLGIPSVIHAALLPRLLGAGRARWMILTGATIDASTALAWGLVDAVAPAGGLDVAVATAIAPILACGPHVIRAQKRLMRQWEQLPLDEAIEAGVSAFAKAYATGEPQRFMRDFAKRT